MGKSHDNWGQYTCPSTVSKQTDTCNKIKSHTVMSMKQLLALLPKKSLLFGHATIFHR